LKFPAGALWRIFPWDPSAHPGQRFGPTFVGTGQTSGRFDLGDRPSVLYLAESSEHAVAEKLQRFRGRRLTPSHLREFGHGLAIVPVTAAPGVVERVADLTDPLILARLGLRPDVIASNDRTATQAIGRRLYEEGWNGLHWWSALTGDWHTTVLFLDPLRVAPGDLGFGAPEPLTLTHPAVVRCAELLGIERS
jgi:hypothetical protein